MCIMSRDRNHKRKTIATIFSPLFCLYCDLDQSAVGPKRVQWYNGISSKLYSFPRLAWWRWPKAISFAQYSVEHSIHNGVVIRLLLEKAKGEAVPRTVCRLRCWQCNGTAVKILLPWFHLSCWWWTPLYGNVCCASFFASLILRRST